MPGNSIGGVVVALAFALFCGFPLCVADTRFQVYIVGDEGDRTCGVGRTEFRSVPNDHGNSWELFRQHFRDNSHDSAGDPVPLLSPWRNKSRVGPGEARESRFRADANQRGGSSFARPAASWVEALAGGADRKDETQTALGDLPECGSEYGAGPPCRRGCSAQDALDDAAVALVKTALEEVVGEGSALAIALTPTLRRNGTFLAETVAGSLCPNGLFPTPRRFPWGDGGDGRENDDDDDDFVVIVTLRPTWGGVVAYGAPCAFDPESGRPVAGIVNVSPSFLRASASRGGTLGSAAVRHELVHALGFEPLAVMHGFGKVGGGQAEKVFVEIPTTAQGRGGAAVRTFVVSRGVRDAARSHFGCDTLDGAEIAWSGTGLHWSSRVFGDELMTQTPVGLVPPALSPITLSFFSDAGWYALDASARHRDLRWPTWGQGRGCEFAASPCPGTSSGPAEAAVSWPGDGTVGENGWACPGDASALASEQVSACYRGARRFRAICTTARVGSSSAGVPPQFQYYDPPVLKKGFAGRPAQDFCPLWSVGSQALFDCGDRAAVPPASSAATDSDSSALRRMLAGTGESYGDGGRCLVGTYDGSPTVPRSFCHRARCVRSDGGDGGGDGGDGGDATAASVWILRHVWVPCTPGHVVSTPDGAAFAAAAEAAAAARVRCPALESISPHCAPAPSSGAGLGALSGPPAVRIERRRRQSPHAAASGSASGSESGRDSGAGMDLYAVVDVGTATRLDSEDAPAWVDFTPCTVDESSGVDSHFAATASRVTVLPTLTCAAGDGLAAANAEPGKASESARSFECKLALDAAVANEFSRASKEVPFASLLTRERALTYRALVTTRRGVSVIGSCERMDAGPSLFADPRTYAGLFVAIFFLLVIGTGIALTLRAYKRGRAMRRFGVEGATEEELGPFRALSGGNIVTASSIVLHAPSAVPVETFEAVCPVCGNSIGGTEIGVNAHVENCLRSRESGGDLDDSAIDFDIPDA